MLDHLSARRPLALAALYRTLGRLREAGLPPSQAAGIASEHPVRGAEAATRALAEALRAGVPLGEAALRSGTVPAHHAAILDAGERSGRLDDALAQLAEACEAEGSVRRQVVAAVRYPMLVLIVAGLVVPLPTLVASGIVPALALALLILAVPAGVLFGLDAILGAHERGASNLAALPGMRAPVELAARARWCRVAALTLGSGLEVSGSFALAAEAAGGGAVGRAARQAQRAVEGRRPMTEVLRGTGLLTGLAAPLAAEAEATGRLDRALLTAATLYEEEWTAALKRRLRVLATVTFGVVVLFVTWRVAGSVLVRTQLP